MFKATNKSAGEIISFLQTHKQFEFSKGLPVDRKLVTILRLLPLLVDCIKPAYIRDV